ncbi:MAG: hypothetical protein Q4A32_03200 [Lachnospiraceae bacterium]|nr:hypothetical protein [Lachnospiraceae bacterium]
MYLIKKRSEVECPVLTFSTNLFHEAHALKADYVHVDGDGFAFDLERIENSDYNPTYFSNRWKGQNAYFPYDYYDENATNSLFLPFLKMFSQVFISEANEYTVVLTGLILKYTDADIYFTDDRIRWFYNDDERLYIVESFPEINNRTLTINGLEQDLVFDRHFKTMGPIGAFHNVFFLQGHGVMDLDRYKYADIVLDEKAGIGSVLNTLSKSVTAMREIGLETISVNKILGQFDSSMLGKYFIFDLTHDDANESNTVFFHEIAALKSTAFMYLAEPEIDLHVLKPSFLEELDEYMTAILGGKRTLGVLIRGTDYINMFKTGNRMMSSPSEMVPMIDEWMEKYGYEKLFLATEDMDILKWMREHYKGKLLAVSQERHSVQDLRGTLLLADLDKLSSEDPNLTLEETTVNYFYALYMLSQCQGFICSGYCNGYDLVLNFNQNKFEHVYLFQKGES